LTFLEGYLWDEGEPQKAFDKAIKFSNKTAMSLSDQFCVERHKERFLNLVKDDLDIVFSNEQEILSLINVKTIEEVVSFSKRLNKLIVITRGENGSIAVNGNDVFECGTKSNLSIVDLTGAGDLFAAGFLHGRINNLSIQQSLEKGTELSTKIIQKLGARI
jgi:fructokinase